MKQFGIITDEDVIEGAINKSPEHFYKRQAARAIVLSEFNEVYLLHMSTNGYHKLPGGGVDEGEDIETALYRELMEEIGCSAEIISVVGTIREYRSQMEWDQTSYCFIAKQTGPLGPTALEPGEIEEGAKTVIAGNIDEAILLLENDTPLDYEGKFIQRRDLILLREAKALLGQ